MGAPPRIATLACGALAAALMACAEEAPPREPRNGLLITLDTTRADALGSYGAPPSVSPALDQLAREGIVYEQARTVAPITLPAHVSMLTGLYPPRHGARDNGWSPLSREAVTLAERAREAGLRTGAFVAAAVLDSAYGLDQGFEVYRAPERKPASSNVSVPYDPAPVVAMSASQWLAGVPRDDRFFVWLHLFDPHFPLRPTPSLLERVGGNTYLAEVALADAAVGQLLAQLAASGRLDETLIAVVGDHGEGRGDHGESAHGVFAYDSTLRVPFLLRYGDGRRAGTRSDEIVSVVDVYATFVDALGLGEPDDVDGVSLHEGSVPPGRGAYFESYYGHLQYGWAPLVGWVDRGGKYLYAARGQFFSLADDPGEHNDRGASGVDVTAYRESIASVLAVPALPAEHAVPSEVAAQLERLGYATAGGTPGLTLPDPFSEHGLASPHDRRDEAEALNRALTAASERDFERASALLRGLLEDNPDHPSALHYYAAAMIERGHCAQALRVLDRLEAVGRMRPASLINYGNCLLRLDRADEAVAYFERAIALDPRSPGARQGLERAIASDAAR